MNEDKKNNAASITADREIVTTRVFDAPRELVFKAWTERQHVAKWWGPNGFTNTIYEMDVRPGGVWRFVMHGPDGVDYQNKIVFVEIVKPQRLVYDHVSAPKFHVTVDFDQHGADGAQTKRTMRSIFDSAKERDLTIEKFGALEGAKQHLGRLGEYVAQHAAELCDVPKG